MKVLHRVRLTLAKLLPERETSLRKYTSNFHKRLLILKGAKSVSADMGLVDWFPP